MKRVNCGFTAFEVKYVQKKLERHKKNSFLLSSIGISSKKLPALRSDRKRFHPLGLQGSVSSNFLQNDVIFWKFLHTNMTQECQYQSQQLKKRKVLSSG